MTTQSYYLSLLEAVKEAGRDPRQAYLVRSRLRRALVALERGRRGTNELPPLRAAPTEITGLVADLRARVAALCQPSEALGVGWRLEWEAVLADVDRLERWLEASRIAA
jgi:hypothetical protein